MNSTSSGPNVRIPPPLLFASGYLAGWLLENRAMRLQLGRDVVTPDMLFLIGGGLIILGAILSFWALLTFRSAGTPVLPFRSASQLVTSGPYRFSRNPMYVGMSAIYAGLSLAMNMAWPLLLLPLVLLALYSLVVSREERHLVQRFGEEYDSYRKAVRRWM
jgi:protein-S-isoprenylcysteine O-methyltransferase Ste14